MSEMTPQYFHIFKPTIRVCEAYNKPITTIQHIKLNVKSLMKYLQSNSVQFIKSLVGSDEPCSEDRHYDVTENQ